MALLAALVSLPAWAWDEPEVSLEAYSTLSTNFVTPHTPWARPNALGTLRGYALIYAPSEGMLTSAREAVELMQRLDIKLDASYRYEYYSQSWFGGSAGERRVARLMAKPYDVFIFQDQKSTQLPVAPPLDARTPFLAQVRAGAGVVLIGANDDNLFKDAKVVAEQPAFLAGTGAI